MAQEYDVLVIGSGPAGGVAAGICNKAGLSVAVAEKNGFGGVCPLRGCEPKKTLMEAAFAVRRVQQMRGNGIGGAAHVDWPELMRFKNSFTEPIPEKVQKSYQQRGITAVHGSCAFVDQEELVVLDAAGEETERIRPRRVLVAAGARPRELDFPGSELMITSDDFFELHSLPQRVLFIGGGFVSIELATITAAAGSQATVATHGDRFLRGFDAELVDQLQRSCEEQGIAMHKNLPAQSLEKEAQGLVLHAGEGGATRLEADLVVNGAGRVPNTDELQLGKGNLAHEHGALLVDAQMRSQSNSRVFAAGDCVARGMPLTPVAVHQAEVAAHNILHDLGKREKSREVDLTGVPSVVFSDPPLAAVGLQQEQAEEQGPTPEVLTGDASKWAEYQRIGRRHAGYKILLHKADGRILGGHFLGEGAEELASLLGLCMQQGLHVDALREAIWAYPSHAYTLRYMLG